MIKYFYDNETEILETTISGKTTVNDLLDYISTLQKDKSLPEKLKILTDASNGNLSEDVEPEDLHLVVEANNKILAAKEFIYDAFILSSSLETAMGQLYKEFSKANNYRFNIFSTKEAAIRWLNSF